MLQLSVNNIAIPLNEKAKITFKQVSPLFRDEIGYASSSYAFSIPNSPIARKAFNFPEVAETRTKPVNIVADLAYKGLPIHRGEIIVERARQSDYRASFLLDESAFSKTLKQYQLKEIDLGGDRIISAAAPSDTGDSEMITHANTVTTGTADDYDYAFFPIHNEQFYELPTDPVQGTHPTYGPNFYIGGTFADPIVSGLFDSQNMLVPFPYLRYIIEQMASLTGNVFEHGTFFTDAAIASLVVYNTYALDTNVGKLIDDFYNDHYHYAGTINLQNHVPDVNTYDFLLNFKRLMNLVVLIRNQKVRIIPKIDLIEDLDAIDWRDKVVSYELDHKAKFKTQKYKSIVDENDGIYGTQEDEKPVAVTEVDTVDDLPLVLTNGSIAKVRSVNAFYIQSHDSGDWEFLTYDTFEVGSGDNTEENLISTLETDFEIFTLIAQTMPRAYQPGSTVKYNIGDRPYAPRLLFYNGIKTAQTSVDPGPITENHPWGFHQSNDPTPYSLRWQGSRGLYAIWHQPWEAYLADTKTIKFKIALSLVDIRSIQWEKKYRLRTWQGEVIGFFKEIQYSIDQKGISLVSAEFVRV